MVRGREPGRGTTTRAQRENRGEGTSLRQGDQDKEMRNGDSQGPGVRPGTVRDKPEGTADKGECGGRKRREAGKWGGDLGQGGGMGGVRREALTGWVGKPKVSWWWWPGLWGCLEAMAAGSGGGWEEKGLMGSAICGSCKQMQLP